MKHSLFLVLLWLPATAMAQELEGIWRQETPGLGDGGVSYWELTFKRDGVYEAIETGPGNARGTARLKNNVITLHWQTGAYRGFYEWKLAGKAGTGKLYFTQWGAGDPRGREVRVEGQTARLFDRSSIRFVGTLPGIIERAIEAHGGRAALDKHKAVQLKAKGTSDFGRVPFTQTLSLQLPKQFKNVLVMNVQGKKQTMVQLLNGDKVSFSLDGQIQRPRHEVTTELKETAHVIYLAALTPLLDRDTYKLSFLGESNVDGKSAIGVKVESPRHKDIQLYFDQASGLLVKTARRTINTATMTEHLEEAFRSDFKEIDGVKVAMRAVVHMDGQRLAEAQVVDFRFFDELDESVFTDEEAAPALSKAWLVAAVLGGVLLVAAACFLWRKRRSEPDPYASR